MKSKKGRFSVKIVLDAMGGDKAPNAAVEAAILASQIEGVEILLVGKEDEIKPLLGDNTKIEMINATEKVEMDDDPSTVLRDKKDSSMAVGLRLLRDEKADAMVSAGSTGALLSGATLIAKRIRGIRRAALAPVLPNFGRGTVLIDCGANVECTPEYLLQFSYMGSFYSERFLGIEKPRVGLLSNGTEESKGASLQKETYALLKTAGENGRINFIGNVEGSDVFSGNVDVVVTDGFTGNILLKTCEGLAEFIFGNLKQSFKKNFKTMISALLIKKDLKEMASKLDSNSVGGTPLLGISKPVIKAHGSSNAEALLNAVKQAKSVYESRIIEEIESNIELMRL